MSKVQRLRFLLAQTAAESPGATPMVEDCPHPNRAYPASPSFMLNFDRFPPLPPALDGSKGENRHPGDPRIGAATDREAIRAWLMQFRGGELFRNQKEVLRFVAWAIAIQKKPFSSITSEDWNAYIGFMGDPQPADIWIGRNRKASLASDADYRHFTGPLAPRSMLLAQAALWAAFDWLQKMNFVVDNPIVPLLRGRSAFTKEYVAEVDVRQLALNSIEKYPRRTCRDVRRYAQARFLIALFFDINVRVDEAAAATMGDVTEVKQVVDGGFKLYLRLERRGRVRFEPLSDGFLAELRSYRHAFGLKATSLQNAATPLVLSTRTYWKLQPVSVQVIYSCMKLIFELASIDAKLSTPSAVPALREAATYWLRYAEHYRKPASCASTTSQAI